MKPFPKIHDLYMARVLLGTVLLTWAVLLGLDVVMAVVTELNDVGTGRYGFGSAVAVVALSIPIRAYTLFPFGIGRTEFARMPSASVLVLPRIPRVALSETAAPPGLADDQSQLRRGRSDATCRRARLHPSRDARLAGVFPAAGVVFGKVDLAQQTVLFCFFRGWLAAGAQQ